MAAAPTTRRTRCSEGGYVLLALLLIIALMVIAAAVVAPKVAFSIKRDREQELIHRGVQYTRAIRAFSRKFGRFPNSIEELQNTNGQRFLRKRYKDPITGQDFKLLHLTDVQLSGSGGVGALMQGSLNAAQGQGQGQAQLQAQVLGGLQAAGALGTVASNAVTQGLPGQAPNAQPDQNAASNSSDQDNSQPGATKPDAQNPVAPAVDTIGTSKIGGGAIVGVASVSKQRTIREFGHKNHYNDWQFYYDPGFDRGFAITGPTVRMTLPTPSLNPGGTPGTTESQAPPSGPPQPQQ
jgi:type II secretory pathway pseudopilin PulG